MPTANPIPLLGGGITLIGLDGTLSSSAQISGDFGSLAATGSTVIESLSLAIASIPADLSAFVGVSLPPNTMIDLAALGILNATLILNEQIVASDSSAIEVNAVHLTLGLARIAADIRVGHSEAQMIAAVPEPGGLMLCLVGVATFVYVRRNKSITPVL